MTGARPGEAGLSPYRFVESARTIESELGRVIVGQRDVVRGVLIGLLAGGHVLLEGVPGLGKTLLVRTLGAVLDLSFSRVQFTPDLMPADITGTNVIVELAESRQPPVPPPGAGNPRPGAASEARPGDGWEGVAPSRRTFQFQPGPLFANLVLADEINRATPKTQSALLEAMQERRVTSGRTTHALPQPFFVLATQNPIEMEGTYPLPEAQLDRFLLKLHVPYPSEDELLLIAERTTGAKTPEAERVADADTIQHLLEFSRHVPIAEPVLRYAARLTRNTHPEVESAPASVRRYVRYGSSPRGMQALVLGAKVRALLEGRYNVAFDDLRALAGPALRHRIILGFEADAEGVRADQLVADAVAATPED